MFSAFLKLLLSQRLLVLMVTVVLVIGGALAWRHLPIDAFPDVTNVQVMILAKAPGLAAIEVEQKVSFPLEQSMSGLPRVTMVRSLSKAELAQVVVVFEDSVDTYWTRQVVNERLGEVREALPEGVEPEMGPISTGLGEIFQYTLEGGGLSAMELRTLQDWAVAPMLKPLSGVNEVNSFGGYVKQYQVLAQPDKLLKYHLTLQDLAEVIEDNNANAGGGVLVRGWEQNYVRGLGLLQGIPDLERIVVATEDGTPVYLRDVAEVVIGGETRQGAVSRDGTGEVVAGMVIMLKGENSKDVVTRVKEAIPKIQNALPKGVSLNVFYDRTSLIQACIDTVMNALKEGSIFVILVLFMFVAELRTALIVVFTLPFTFLVSFIIMGQTGLSSNLMSLGGLAFSVGMVVDASIVVVENIRRHFAEQREKEQRRATMLWAVNEVASPVAFSVVIIVIILTPLYSLQGIEGKMFAPLVSTMLIALMVSLVVALTVVPVISEMILKQEPEKEFRFIRRFHHSYLRLLDRALAHPGITMGISIAALVVAAALTPLIGTEFMPALDEGAIAINVVRLPNASLDGSVKVADFMEKRLLKFPEVETVVSKTGRAEISEDPMGPEQNDLLIMLKPRKEWHSGRSKAELVEAINDDLSQIPGLRLSFSQPIALRVNELISGVKSDLAVKIFGPDLDKLKSNADRIAAILGSIEGASDVKVEQVSGMSQWDIEINRQEAARFGINIADINSVIETAVAGRKITTVLEEQKRFAVILRYSEGARKDLGDLQRLLIPAPGGERVPLARFATIREVEAPAQVSREKGMRRVVVECNIRGRDLGGFVAEVQQRIEGVQKELSPGYFFELGGQFENQQRAMQRLTLVVPIALLLILILLYLALGSLSPSLLVLLNLPFALIGGIIAVVVFQMELSVSAYIAFIVLLGIAVQNGVVLMAFFVQLRKQGRTILETVRGGCNLRFRPLLMTAITSFIGHLPMLYATGSGADIQKPLAVVVMGGLISSQALTLIVLPVLYSMVESWFEKREQNGNSSKEDKGD